MIKAVSFDCAQTLLEVRWDAHLVAIESAQLAGLSLPSSAANDYRRLFSSRHLEWAQACSRHYPAKTSDVFWQTLSQDWLDLYGQKEQAEKVIEASHSVFFGPESRVFKPFPGAADALKELKSAGMKLIVLSNWDDSLEKALKHCSLHEPFDFIYASLIEGAEKPDPAFFELAQKDLGLEPHEILHIGDNPLDDGIGALNVGWKTLLIHSDLAAGPWKLDEAGRAQLQNAKIDASPWVNESSWPPSPVMTSYSQLPKALAEFGS